MPLGKASYRLSPAQWKLFSCAKNPPAALELNALELVLPGHGALLQSFESPTHLSNH